MVSGELSADERNALADALARTGGDFGQLTAALFPQEQDAKVRSTMAMTLRRASAESAQAGLLLALADADAQVRADAAHAAASHPELEALRAPLRNALNDGSSVTRASAARALGVLKDGESASTILTMVNDEDAETRLQALRALKRIDTSLLAQVNLAALQSDADPRVAKEAAKLSRAAN
jgi:HEAT repeat protein